MKIISTLSFCCAAFISVHAQSECDGGRYQTPIFQQVSVSSDISYGQAVNSDNFTVDLLCDIYEPAGDNATNRPVVIMAHGGSFYAGNKTADSSVVYFCRELAKHGYLTVSMNYRLENPLNIFTSSDIEKTFLEAVFRAVQDQKALIRFLRKSVAEQNNPYGIDPNRIIVGGNSAGAILSLHNAYLDDAAKVPSKIDTAALGGLEGSSGNPGYSSIPQAVVNICGALGDSVWLESGDQPFVSLHGDQDEVVPHNTGVADPGIPIMTVDGSASLKLRADNEGVNNAFYLLKGAEHSPQNGSNAYMDTVFTFARDFLADLVCNGILDINPIAETSTPVPFPNPSSSGSFLAIDQGWTGHLALFDALGRLCLERRLNQPVGSVSLPQNLKPGVYWLKHTQPNGAVKHHKLLIQ